MDLISRKLIIEEANERQKNGDYITKGFIKSLPSAFKGMTCGEVIQSIFPSDRPAKRSRCCVHYNYMTFLVDFWDSPYQKGGE